MNEAMELERRQALSEVNNALPVLEQVKNLYMQALNINEQLTLARVMKIRECKEKEIKQHLLKFIPQIAVYFIAWAALTSIVSSISYRLLPSSTTSGITLLFAFAPAITLLVIKLIYDRSRMERFASLGEMTPEEEAPFEADFDLISQAITQLSVENEDRIDPIPRDYRNYDAVVYFERVLANGQAYSMREALNLYEEYLHRQRLEANSLAALEQANQQSQMLAEIERQSSQVAAGVRYLVISDFLR